MTDLIDREAINKLRRYNLIGGMSTVSLEDINKLPSVKQEPCEDAINRAEAQTALMMSKAAYLYIGHPTIRISDAVQAIRELPSVTQKPDNKYRKEARRWKNKWLKSQKSGHWIHDGSHWKNRSICSECNYKLFDEPTNYCPDCGARMGVSE